MNKKTQAIAILLGGLLFIAIVIRTAGNNINGRCYACMPEKEVVRK